VQVQAPLTVETLPSRGTYTLIILLNKKSRLRANRLGCFDLKKGYYAYTGSAMGEKATSLRARVKRHLKKTKNKHWHIDFLLTSKSAQIAGIVAAETDVNQECQINNQIKNIPGTTVPVEGFGSTDCKHGCKSHLVYLGAKSQKEKITDVYRHVFGSDRVSILPLITDI